MDILILTFVLIILVGIKPSKDNKDYLGKDTTTVIKGIFAIIILFSHSRQYLSVSINSTSHVLNQYNYIYNIVLDFLGQLMVVMFLLYSGYGVVESYKKKGNSYTKGFFKKRVLKTLVHFDIAVLLFLILAFWIGKEYNPRNVILSFTGLTSIGNSNWFVFDILVLYLLSYIGFVWVKRNGQGLKHYLWLVFSFSCGFLITMFILKRGESWWYDTILAYPTGMLWSVYQNRINNFLCSSTKYILTTIATLIIFIVFYYIGRYYVSVISILTSAIFGCLIILITIKCKINNKILHWLGVNAFAIYILQRIPMIIASEYGLSHNHILFALFVFPVTLAGAYGFTKFTSLLDNKFFK